MRQTDKQNVSLTTEYRNSVAHVPVNSAGNADLTTVTTKERDGLIMSTRFGKSALDAAIWHIWYAKSQFDFATGLVNKRRRFVKSSSHSLDVELLD